MRGRRAKLRAMLEQRRAQILERLRERSRGVRAEAAARPASAVDEGQGAESHADISLALMQVESETLRLIDRALERLAQGRYGDCVACESQIAPARLAALPFAMRCKACEEAREDGQRWRSTSTDRQFAQRGDALFDR
jgi:DnaK suppressor protein